MSFVLPNPNNPDNSDTLPGGGLDIQGMEDAENQLEGSENGDRIVGGNLNDIISSLGGDDTVLGGAGNDTILGGSGNDEIAGNEGNDIINGGTGNNIITGGNGDDRLVVESGGSTLTGDAGSDVFRLNFTELRDGGEDTTNIEDLGLAITEITDFEPGEDRIRIEGLGGNQAPIYNRDTGILSLDDVEIAQLATDLSIDPGDIEIADNNNPLSTVDNSESNVYRFLNPSVGVHFYTSSEGERQNVEENLPIYSSEGESYKSVDPTTGAREVYRFLNPATGVHLYTTDRGERDNIIENIDSFQFEGVQFYAYDTPVEGSIPVYRFLEPSLGVHFYTPNEGEKDFVQANLPNYNFEGVAYYALPVDGSEG